MPPASPTTSSRGRGDAVKRDQLQQLSGQRQYPVIEFEDGSVYRAPSKDMAATIAAGGLDSKRGERPS